MRQSNMRRWRVSAWAFFLFVSAVAPAQAQSYPDRPIKFIVGFGSGGPTDIVARVLADHLSGILKQKVIVENKPGASGNLATQAVASAEADGRSEERRVGKECR